MVKREDILEEFKKKSKDIEPLVLQELLDLLKEYILIVIHDEYEN